MSYSSLLQSNTVVHKIIKRILLLHVSVAVEYVIIM